MTAHWIKTSIAALALLAFTAGCTPRAFEPGVYHPRGNPDRSVHFMADGTVVFSHASGSTQVEDLRHYYRVSGKHVMFSGGRYCGSDDGRYTWDFSGNALKLTVLREAQSERKDSLTADELVPE